MSSVSTAGLQLSDFIAYDLPQEKWLKFLSPKMRLRVRGKRRDFISSVVKVDDRRPDESVCWPWNDERSSRPTFADEELFEIVVERRFLLRYKCIRRTKSVTIDQMYTSDHVPCTLPLYDGQHCAGVLEDKIEIGKISFTLS